MGRVAFNLGDDRLLPIDYDCHPLLQIRGETSTIADYDVAD